MTYRGENGTKYAVHDLRGEVLRHGRARKTSEAPLGQERAEDLKEEDGGVGV